MKRRTTAVLAAILTLSAGAAACQGLKEAFTAHVDNAATAGSQQLTVEHLAKLLGGVQVPLTPDIAKAVAGIWIDYQLIGTAAAHSDTLNEQKFLDDALWTFLSNQKEQKYMSQVQAKFANIDTAGLAAKYMAGDYLAAQHILFVVAPTATDAQKDSVRKLANKVRAELTAANFAAMAQKYSGDPGSAARGGSLGVFQKGQMVKQFQDALVALQPGQISQPVVTQFGYHIIRRNTYAEVKEDFARAVSGPALQRADSIYLAGLESASNVQIAADAPATVKSMVTDMDAHENDKKSLATWKGGELTVGRLVKWFSAAPVQEQLRDQVLQMPDTALKGLLKQVVISELVLRAADSAKVTLDSAEMTQIRQRYTQAVVNTWTALGMTPTSLADSGKTVPAREKIAAARADVYLEKMMAQQAQFVPVAPPVRQVATAKYGMKLNNAGLQRAIDIASKGKAAADSQRAKSRPPTEVPIGGAQPPAAPPAPPAAPPKPPTKKP